MGQNARAYDNPRGREALTEQLINRKLLLLDAKRNLFERDEEFKAQLAKIKDELLYNYAVKKALSGARVTDDEVKKYYDEHKSDMVSKEKVNVSHILVEEEDACRDIMEEIKRGDISFEDAAAKYSSCPSKDAGGALGEASRGQFVPEFENAMFGAEEGALVGPVKTQFGYHIIRVNSKIPSEEMDFDEIKEQLRESLLREKQQNTYASKIRQLMIMYPVDRF
ncbi:MAG: peptidyl-prolyl cis-trans isomerase [Clostridia bacterium]|nr:peptidyl-prolyl cis-trans isomerase [Clostridia bacterium]